MALDSMNDVNEETPIAKNSTILRKKHSKWTTAQNLVLLGGWIKYGTDSVIGRNQKSEAYWGKIAEYCNEHCSFVLPRDGSACRNHYNNISKILSKWVGAYHNAHRMKQSGWSENDILTKAHELYKSGKNVNFNLMSEWQRILQVSEARGFPGMIESIDCMHWEWKNCPTAWEGQFTRRDKGTTTVILEAVAFHDLWIWHALFGCPGTLNDINILDRSPLFDDVEQGNTPRVNFFVNQRPYNMAYYLADGIYPSYPTFVKSIRLPQSEQDKLFAKYQEGCRKDIERAFGVLQARFKIIREPARMWDINDLAIIMRSCIILHNMIVEDERDSYAQNWSDYDQAETSESSTTQPFSTELLPAFANHVRARSELRDANVYHELQEYLVKHIWAKFGMFHD